MGAPLGELLEKPEGRRLAPVALTLASHPRACLHGAALEWISCASVS